MDSNEVKVKSLAFAKRIVQAYQYLCEDKKEFVLSKQILKSGTSIGANISEAQRAQSKADFISKMSIALKEANETEYWLRLLYETQYISKTQFENLHNDLSEIIKILMAICKTSNQNK